MLDDLLIDAVSWMAVTKEEGGERRVHLVYVALEYHMKCEFSALQVPREATAINMYCSSFFEVHKIAFLSKITMIICLYALSCVEFSSMVFIALAGLDSPMKAQMMLLLVESGLSY